MDENEKLDIYTLAVKMTHHGLRSRTFEQREHILYEVGYSGEDFIRNISDRMVF